MILGRRKILWVLYLLFVLLSACEDAEITTTEYLKVFFQSASEENVLSLHMEPTTDGGYLIFGICGTEIIESKFETGSLYLLKTDENGDIVWQRCYSEFGVGVPSNITRTPGNGDMKLIWNNLENNTFQLITINNDELESISFPTVETPACGTDCGNLMYISNSYNDTGFAGISFIQDPIDEFLFGMEISTYDNEFNLTETLSTRLFRADNFNISDINLTSTMKEIDNSLYLGVDNNVYLYNGPSNNRMSMAYLGEVNVMYSDPVNWVTAIEQIGTESVNIVVSSPLAQDFNSTFIPDLQLASRNLDFEDLPNKVSIENINPNHPILINQLISAPKTAIVGTAGTDRVVLYLYDHSEGAISNTYIFGTEESTLGEQNNYRVASIREDVEGNLIVMGTVLIKDRFQRPYIIQVDKNDL